MTKGQDELFPESLALPEDGHRNKWLCTETVLCSASLVSHRGVVPAPAHVGFVTEPLPALETLCASSHGILSSHPQHSWPQPRLRAQEWLWAAPFAWSDSALCGKGAEREV